ncbi:hypothetical protein [Glycomyces tenuis]|uniref:hypothetical protein n=1 Tax=Glycomyces tenuis TaxID=58116 RepID=UPI0006843C6E|nr:hypothetical protein [Glycomyces tenuis]
MNKKLLLASTGAAVIAAAGFGSIALAQDDTPSEPTAEHTSGPSGELDAVPDDATAGDGQELFESEGGTVLAECTADGPELVWWAPAEGYTVDDVEAVPYEDDDGRDDDDDRDDDAEVEFTNGSLEVDYDVTCADGQPQANVTTDDESDDDRDDDDDDDDRDDDSDDDDGDDGDDDRDDDDDDDRDED